MPRRPWAGEPKPPEPYPRWPRQLPPIPESINSDEIRWVAKFVNDRLARFHQVEEREAEARRHLQVWTVKTSKRWETRIWLDIGVNVLLGTRFICNHISYRSRSFDGEALRNFNHEVLPLIKFHTDLREGIKSEAMLRPYSWKFHPVFGVDMVNEICEWTEFRASMSTSCYEKLRESDKIRRPKKYLQYVLEAEQEWLMIKKYKAAEVGRGNFTDNIPCPCSDAFIKGRLTDMGVSIMELQGKTVKLDY